MNISQISPSADSVLDEVVDLLFKPIEDIQLPRVTVDIEADCWREPDPEEGPHIDGFGPQAADWFAENAILKATGPIHTIDPAQSGEIMGNLPGQCVIRVADYSDAENTGLGEGGQSYYRFNVEPEDGNGDGCGEVAYGIEFINPFPAVDSKTGKLVYVVIAEAVAK